MAEASLVTGNFQPPPSKGATLTATPTHSGPSSTRVTKSCELSSCSSQPLSLRAEAFPRGLEAPGCSSLCPLGRHSPTSDFPSGHCWNAQPTLCVFSLWVGAWELEALLTSSPHPLFGGPNLQRVWSQRGGCGAGQATSWPPRAPVGKENWAMGGCLGSIFQTYHHFPSVFQSMVSTV